MKYKFMEEYKQMLKVESICEELKVSKNGFYAWHSPLPSVRRKDNQELL
jgi:hypothetical protein